MSFMTLRALRAGSVLARSMAAAALRVSLVAARSSAMSTGTGPTSSRMFSVLTPALYPAAVKKTTTSKTAAKKKAPAKKVAANSRSVAKSKTATKSKIATKSKAATKSKSTTKSGKAATTGRKRVKRKVLTAEEKAEKQRELAAKKKRAEIKAIPKAPKRSATAYGIFMQKEYANHARSGAVVTEASAKMASAWRALSDAERQRYSDQASAIQPLRVAQREKWATTIGYQALLKLNRSRVLEGKQKIGIPDAIRTHRRTPAYIVFFKEKHATGELGQGHVMELGRVAGKLWRQLSPAEKAAYNARSVADWEGKQASKT